MGRVSSCRAGHSNGHAHQRHKSDLKGNRFQSKLFRQQVEVQKEQTVEHQRLGNSKINYTYNINLTSTQQLMLLFTIMGVLLPVITAHQDNLRPSSSQGKDSKSSAVTPPNTLEPYQSEAVTSPKVNWYVNRYKFKVTMPYPELNEKPATNLRELLLQKTYYDDDVFTSEEEFEKCEYIVDQVFKTMEKLPSSKGHIERSIRDPRFKLQCITNDKLARENFLGRFVPKENSLYVKTIIADREGANIEPTLHHEFRHADFSLLHQNEGCFTYRKLAPFFPITPDMIKKFTEALDLGDNRVKEFNSLFKQKQDGKFLNLTERKLLNKYKEASKECFPYVSKENISELDLMNLLSDSGWLEGEIKENINIFGVEAKLLELGGSGQDNDPYYALIQSINGMDSLLATPDYVSSKLPFYSNWRHDPLAEREAYTMQRLSIKAMEVFYPEAYQITQEFINICSIGDPIIIDEPDLLAGLFTQTEKLIYG
ncbi:MAG: hypothetical protein ACK4M7_00720 [Burkholderiales bacterium]